MTLNDIASLIPYGILALGALLILLTGAFATDTGPKALNMLGAALALAAGLSAVFCTPSVESATLFGGFIQPDGFGRFFTAVSSFSAFLVLLLSRGYGGRKHLGNEEYPALVLFAAFGMSLLASSNSLLGIFLGLECMSLAFYVLLASNKSDPLSGEAGLKYLIIGAISTAFFAYGLSLIYAESGTLSLSGSMSAMYSGGRISPVGLAGWAMLIVGMGFKTSLFPFHFWAPDVYEGGPAPVVAFLSTMSKASVFAVFIKLALLSAPGWASLVPALWVISAATMAFGNIAALTQNNIKRLLAYSSIAQMGYVLLAVISTPASGGTTAVFYLIAYIAMDLGAFGAVAAFSGKDHDLGDISSLRGLGYTHPYRSLVLSVCLISLAGLPPTAGFIGKFGIFYSAVKAGYVNLSVLGIITAIISVFYYLRVVVYLYMRGDEPADDEAHPVPALDFAGQAGLAVIAAVVIYLGVLPGRLLDLISSFMGA
jgi:NADH-quinone oxidoreductase subunit N